MLLRDIGYTQIKPGYVYDNAARDIVKKIQEKHGIEVDGIVGARTKIIIYNEKKDLIIPHIFSSNDRSIEK
jgi:murein L,D-transpeptidase YcbB/YkuD